MIVARDSLFTAPRRFMTVSSGTSRPAEMSASIPPESITHTSRSSGRPTCVWATVFACSRVSTKAATAPESDRIHSTCSAEEVSYIGTVTPAAVQIAKSHSIHSNRVWEHSATRSPA